MIRFDATENGPYKDYTCKDIRAADLGTVVSEYTYPYQQKHSGAEQLYLSLPSDSNLFLCRVILFRTHLTMHSIAEELIN